MTLMKAFLIYSLNGTEHKIAPCIVADTTQTAKTLPLITIDSARKSALTYAPILFRALTKEEIPNGTSPESNVIQLRQFDLTEYDTQERIDLMRLLKCYYKRADDIRDGLTDESLSYIYDEWDSCNVSPKVWSRILPKTKEDAVRWHKAFSGWFGANDPVCKFWDMAKKNLF